MKTRLQLILFTLLLGSSAYAQIAFHLPASHPFNPISLEADPAEYSRNASLPNGFNFSQFASQHLQYPELARTYGIEGTVILQINVASSGETHFVKILKSLGYGCDRAAIKMVESLPHFIPAVFRGQNISSNVNLEIRFKM